MENEKEVNGTINPEPVTQIHEKKVVVEHSQPVQPIYNERVIERPPVNVGAYRDQAAIVKRISWGAIFAGVVMTLVTQLLLNILGLGIGASTINPVSEQNPANGIATGAGIWFVFSSLIALFVGGWVAGRLAGIPRATDSLLHGLVTWGLGTLVLFYFLSSLVGSLIGGTFRVLGSGLSAVGNAAVATAPAIADAAQNQIQQSGIDIGDIRREAETLLKQTGKPELQPGALANKAKTITNQAGNTASDVANDPANSDSALTAIFDRIQRSGARTIDAADRDALVNVIMARTGKTRPEAEQTVNSYEQTYQKAYQQYEQTKNQAAQTARQVGQSTAEGVTKAAIWGFFALLSGAVAAALGGYLATPKDIAARRSEATI